MIDDDGNYIIDLPVADLRAGTRLIIPIPEGDWLAPPGWQISGRTIHGLWSPGKPPRVVVRPRPSGPLPACGLCGLSIFPDEASLEHGQAAPPAHLACYAKAVEVKVSAQGGPADPNPPVEPPPAEVPAWVQPVGAHDAYPMGARVRHNGKTWESTHAANVWPPAPGSLWREV